MAEVRTHGFAWLVGLDLQPLMRDPACTQSRLGLCLQCCQPMPCAEMVWDYSELIEPDVTISEFRWSFFGRPVSDQPCSSLTNSAYGFMGAEIRSQMVTVGNEGELAVAFLHERKL